MVNANTTDHLLGLFASHEMAFAMDKNTKWNRLQPSLQEMTSKVTT